MSRSASPPAFSVKYEATVAPSRRQPPTALNLVGGPLPPRNKPKHTLPSIPRPAFYPKRHEPKAGPEARARRKARDVTLVDEHLSLVSQDAAVAPIIIPTFTSLRSNNSSRTSLDSYSSSSDGSSSSGSGPNSPVSDDGNSGFHYTLPEPMPYLSEHKMVRGPWDHSGAIRVPFDVNSVLAPPPAVAVNPY